MEPLDMKNTRAGGFVREAQPGLPSIHHTDAWPYTRKMRMIRRLRKVLNWFTPERTLNTVVVVTVISLLLALVTSK